MTYTDGENGKERKKKIDLYFTRFYKFIRGNRKKMEGMEGMIFYFFILFPSVLEELGGKINFFNELLTLF